MNKNTTATKADELIDDAAEELGIENAAPTPTNPAGETLLDRLMTAVRAATPPPPKPPPIALSLLEKQAHDFICDVVEAQRLAYSRNQSALKAKTHANGKLTEAADLFEYLHLAGSQETEKLRLKLLHRLDELNAEFNP